MTRQNSEPRNSVISTPTTWDKVNSGGRRLGSHVVSRYQKNCLSSLQIQCTLQLVLNQQTPLPLPLFQPRYPPLLPETSVAPRPRQTTALNTTMSTSSSPSPPQPHSNNPSPPEPTSRSRSQSRRARRRKQQKTNPNTQKAQQQQQQHQNKKLPPLSEDPDAEVDEQQQQQKQQQHNGKQTNGRITSIQEIPDLADQDHDQLKNSDGLKLRLELNLDVEIELKARLKGEVVLALLA